jgi:hypothetical protein
MDDPTLSLRSLLQSHSSQTHDATEAARIRNETADFDAEAAAATLVQVPSSMMVISSSDSDIVDVGLGVADLGGASIEEENGEDDAADIAYAAEAASQALEANDAAVSQQQELEAAGFCDPTAVIPNHVIPINSDHTDMSSMMSRDIPPPALPLRCRICQQGEYEGRPIIRFLASNHNDHRLTTSSPGGGTLHPPPPPPPPGVSSFTEEIQLHVFCGKTASILPNVNQPDLEILTKAGLKNKHGIGPEVNAALARTRCAVIPNSTGSNDTSSSSSSKEKQYYLVREFEAHLASIRNAHINFMGSEVSSLPGGVQLSVEQQAFTQDPFNNYQQPQQDQLQPQHLQAQHQYLNHPGGAPPQPTDFYDPYSDSGLDSTLHQHLQLPPPPPPLQQQQAPSHYSSSSYDPYSVNNNHGSHNRNASTANGGIAQNSINNNQKPRRANKAAAGQIAKPKGGRRRRQQEVAPMPLPPPQDNGHNTMMPMDMSSTWSYQDTCSSTPGGEILTPDGKVKCGCGGTHWPSGTSKGSSSWRIHVMTKKHQKWMEDNGMLGAV